jgi:Rad3-related DNA helicase
LTEVTDVPAVEEIVRRASAELFDKKLLTNIHRAVVVEAIVATALEPEWQWCSMDYASCDFRRGGVRLEVKQSASLQSWNAATLKPSKCSFDIAERTGELKDGITWKPGQRRNADIYVLCHHPVVSRKADHRDASQWRFFVVPEASLPKQRTISLGVVERLAAPVGWRDLRRAVAAVRRR